MRTLLKFYRGLLICSLLASTILTLGCGDGRPERVPLTGTVLIDGEPLQHGFIQVVPKEGRPAQSKIDSDGHFELSTFGDNDGCLPGTHDVAVIALETISPTAQKWHAPKKYMSATTSGLTLTVDENTKDVTIELTWDGGEPFEEKFQAE